MKERIQPRIKADLIRGTFLLLLFITVCVIPFALAERRMPTPELSPDLRSPPELPASQLPTGAPTPTCTPMELIINGGFETGSFPPWVIDGTSNSPVVTNTLSHSGTYSAFAGGDPPAFYCGIENEPIGDSSFYQQFTVPAGGGTLSFWYWTCTTDTITHDWQDAYITNSNGTILQTIFHQCTNNQAWVQQTVNVAPYAGQTVRIKFLVHQDGFGDLTGMYVDDVAVYAPCGSPTPTPTVTPTGTPTPPCIPGAWQFVGNMGLDLYGAARASDGTFFYAAGGYSYSTGTTLAVFNRYDPVGNVWEELPDMPQAAAMATAVYYPPTNKIYVFGGIEVNSGDVYNITRIYDIASDTWSTGANMPDVRSFSAGGYVSDTGKIYIISGYSCFTVACGGSNTWAYDPVENGWTDLNAFPHPAGGFAFGVINGKIYIAGGRDINGVINLTWEYDPIADAYTAKDDEPSIFQNNVPGSAAASGLLWVFGGGNPVVGAGGVASISRSIDHASDAALRPFGEGLKSRGQPATSGAGRYYNPTTDAWTSSPNMNTRRSFPSGGAIGNDLIIAAGGLDVSTTTATVETEIPCETPTPTPTASPTPTATATPTATSTSTSTPRPTPTPRSTPPTRPRPTPPPRP